MPKKSKKTEEKQASKKIQAAISGDIIFSNKKEAFTLYEQSRFGESKEGKIVYSIPECLYLVEKEKMEIKHGKKKLNFASLMEKFQKEDSKFGVKYSVFRDMRNRGYVVKTALKFGAEFRVYDKGKKPGEEHALWILYPVKENETLTWHDFSAKNRVAHSTKKNLLIGIVDEEGDVTYYECKWLKP
ncbi:tRNA-intron lyase [Candidatus Pacearchaeota archaeon]|nr:tRNA-intron lyase [Candidatus Pacearchaeota archaeon]